jgi:hypothetical protein
MSRDHLSDFERDIPEACAEDDEFVQTAAGEVAIRDR